jgi:hypothetical protein
MVATDSAGAAYKETPELWRLGGRQQSIAVMTKLRNSKG